MFEAIRKASTGKVIVFGLVIFLTGLFVMNLLLPKHTPNVIFDGNRKTIIEEFVTPSDLRNNLLTRADFYDPDLYQDSIELLGASGKFYFMQVCLFDKPVMKYCTRTQAVDIILGNMIERKFIFNHDDYVFVQNMFERCFDSQIETMFLGEFMTECRIVDEEFANDIENTLLPFEDRFEWTFKEFTEPDIIEKSTCHNSDDLNKLRKESEKIYFEKKREYEEKNKKMQEDWQWAKEHIIDGENK